MKQLAVDSIDLVSRALSKMPDRRTKFKDVFRRGEMYNGEYPGVPCHTWELPWEKGNLIMRALKQVIFLYIYDMFQFLVNFC